MTVQGAQGSGDLATVVASVLWAIGMVGSLWRFGSLAAFAFFVSTTIELIYPVPANPGDWQATSALVAWVVYLVLVGFALFTALGHGQRDARAPRPTGG